MDKLRNHHGRTMCLATLISVLLGSSGLHAQERSPVAEAFSEGTKEFLSDPARTGSLLGSILAGAALANPLAPILGSVAGFMIGKSSAFSKEDKNAARRDAYINRSLVPESAEQVTGIAGLTGNPSSVTKEQDAIALRGVAGSVNQPVRTDPIVIVESVRKAQTETLSDRSEILVPVEIPEEPETDNQSEQTVSLGLSEDSIASGQLQKQLAHACSNVKLSQPMPASCYYFSQ